MLNVLRSVDYDWMIYESLQVYHRQMEVLQLPTYTEEMMRYESVSQQEALEHFRRYNPDLDTDDRFQRKLQVRTNRSNFSNLSRICIYHFKWIWGYQINYIIYFFCCGSGTAYTESCLCLQLIQTGTGTIPDPYWAHISLSLICILSNLSNSSQSSSWQLSAKFAWHLTVLLTKEPTSSPNSSLRHTYYIRSAFDTQGSVFMCFDFYSARLPNTDTN